MNRIAAELNKVAISPNGLTTPLTIAPAARSIDWTTLHGLDASGMAISYNDDEG